MLQIDRDECIECAFCESICPKKAVAAHEEYAFEISDSCISCKLCQKNCPVNAINH